MAITVKEIELWRTEVENKPGVLATTLEPLAGAGADLHILMGYRLSEKRIESRDRGIPGEGQKGSGRLKRGHAASAHPSTPDRG